MRISDGSSDVCSSDLVVAGKNQRQALRLYRRHFDITKGIQTLVQGRVEIKRSKSVHAPSSQDAARAESLDAAQAVVVGRSEEHTSELQSLMRISYAVFCLKKKKQKAH